MIAIGLALLVGIWIGLALDAYLITYRKPRPARQPTEEEENELLRTPPLQWVADAVAKFLDQHKDDSKEES